MNNSSLGNIKIYGYLEHWLIDFPVKIYANGKLIKKLRRRNVFEYVVNEDTNLLFKFATFKKVELFVKSNDNIDIFLSINNKKIMVEGIYQSDPSYNEVKEIFIRKWHNDYVEAMKKDVRLYKLYKTLFILLLFFSYFSLIIIDNFFFTLVIHIISIIGIYRCSRHTKWKSATDSLIIERPPDIWQLDERYYDWINYRIKPLFELKYNMLCKIRESASEILLEMWPNDDTTRRYLLSFSNIVNNLINENNYKYPLYVTARIISCSMTLPHKSVDTSSYELIVGEVDLSNKANYWKAFQMMERVLFGEEVNIMHEYEIKYYVGNSSSTTTVETVTANSEYNAKQIIINKYNGQEVHILNVKMN